MSEYTDEVQQQRAQLSRLYEQQESLTENIKGLSRLGLAILKANLAFKTYYNAHVNDFKSKYLQDVVHQDEQRAEYYKVVKDI
jgi:hypothetical protein